MRLILLLNSCHGRPDLIRPADPPPSPARVRKSASSELLFLNSDRSLRSARFVYECRQLRGGNGIEIQDQGGDRASLSSKRRRLR